MPQAVSLSPEDLAFSNLLAYCRYQWPGYRIAKHHAFIAHKLMAMERGEISRLCLFCPPRHGKTKLASIDFSAWLIGRNPDENIIFGTYSSDRAGDVGRNVKNQVISPEFGAVFPNCKISTDSKSAHKITTLSGGEFFAVGAGEGLTGRGAKWLILDDLIKNREDLTETSKEKLQEWFNTVAYTRLAPGGKIVLIMTRWAYDDIAGYLLDHHQHENWDVVNFPAICEDVSEETGKDVLGRELGEALWPDQYDVNTLGQIKQTLGSLDFNALYQQRPTPKSGGLVSLDWFHRFDLEYQKRYKRIIMSFDTGQKKLAQHDPTALTVWAVENNKNLLIDVFNKRVSYPELYKAVLERHRYWSQFSDYIVQIIIEDKGSGISLLQDLKANTRIPVIGIVPHKNKVERLKEVVPLIESGLVGLPKQAKWLFETETQLARFPLWKHDDIVDSITQFLKWNNKYKLVSSGMKFWK